MITGSWKNTEEAEKTREMMFNDTGYNYEHMCNKIFWNENKMIPGNEKKHQKRH